MENAIQMETQGICLLSSISSKKNYDAELAFECVSFRHNDFTSLFVVMPILYHTICPFVWTFAY
jgi:hypothetical protein